MWRENEFKGIECTRETVKGGGGSRDWAKRVSPCGP